MVQSCILFVLILFFRLLLDKLGKQVAAGSSCHQGKREFLSKHNMFSCIHLFSNQTNYLLTFFIVSLRFVSFNFS